MIPSHRRRPTGTSLVALFAIVALAFACADDGLTQIELPVAQLELVDGCETMIAGESCQIVVNAFTEEGQQIRNPILRYQTTTINVLDVSENGLVTARAPGQGVVLVQSTTGSAVLQLNITVILQNP